MWEGNLHGLVIESQIVVLCSQKNIKAFIDDEKHDSGPSLKKKKIGNHNKIEIMNENGDNMDGYQKFDFGIQQL